MDLANKLTYNGKLECISETTANSCIKMNDEFLSLVCIKMRAVIRFDF